MHSEAVHAKDSSSVLWQKSLGVGLKLAQHSDSMATISQHTRMGLARLKHVELRFLFVKDLLKRERLTLSKIPGTENPADLGTKVLDVNTHRHLCSIIVLRLAEQAVEEIKGNLRNLQSSENIGSCIYTSYGSDAVVRPDETREAGRACVNTTSDQNCGT